MQQSALISSLKEGSCRLTWLQLEPLNDGHLMMRRARHSLATAPQSCWLSSRGAHPTPISGTGCARPRLLKLAGPMGPLLLSGGRLCVEGTKDLSLWCAVCAWLSR
jgi:hypothetical protein